VRVSTDRYGGGDIGAAFNNAREEHGVYGIRYTLERGFHDLDTTMNLTGMSSWDEQKGAKGINLDMRGVQLEQHCPIGIDMTGSHNAVQIWGGRIWGGHQSDVDIGLLLSREVDGGNGSRNEFYGLKINGQYNIAPLYNVSTETNDFFACEFANKRFGNLGGAGFGVSISGDNPNGVESPYTDIDASTYTTGGNKFFGGVIRGHDAVRLRSGRGNPVRLTKFYGTYMGSEDAIIKFDMENEKPMDNIVFRDCWVGDATTNHIFKATPTDSERVIRDLVVDGGRFALGPEAETPEILFGGDRKVRLERAHIRPNVQWLRNSGFVLHSAVDSNIQANIDTFRVDGELARTTIGANTIDGIDRNGAVSRSRLIGLKGGRRQLIDDSNSITTRFNRQGLPRFGSNTTAPEDTLFFNSNSGRVTYKDPNGTVHELTD
jgi:hypothetical protein